MSRGRMSKLEKSMRWAEKDLQFGSHLAARIILFHLQFVYKETGEIAGVDWEFNGWGGDVLPSIEKDRNV